MATETVTQTNPPQNGPYFQSPMNQLGGAIQSLTNPFPELQDMELTFRGVRLDENGHEMETYQPLMNDKGINAIMGMVRSIVNKITIMGNLNKGEIMTMMDFTADTLSKTLMVKTKEYGIVAEDRDLIYYKVLSTCFLCLKRPFEEGDRRFWKGSQQEITTRVEGQHGGKNLFERVFGWGK